MTWCVCLDKDGNLTLVSRKTREALLRWWIECCFVTPPSYVVKTFEDIDEAEKYIEDQKTANEIIDNLLKP